MQRPRYRVTVLAPLVASRHRSGEILIHPAAERTVPPAIPIARQRTRSSVSTTIGSRSPANACGSRALRRQTRLEAYTERAIPPLMLDYTGLWPPR